MRRQRLARRRATRAGQTRQRVSKVLSRIFDSTLTPRATITGHGGGGGCTGRSGGRTLCRTEGGGGGAEHTLQILPGVARARQAAEAVQAAQGADGDLHI